MRLFMVSPPESELTDYDMMVLAFSPRQAIELFQEALGEPPFIEYEQKTLAAGPDDDWWTCRQFPEDVTAGSARVIDWSDCEITFWHCTGAQP